MAALILEINTRGLHRYQPIANEVTTIGRALDNDIILSDPTVAAHHLKIIRYGDSSVEIVNLTDVNPTRINSRKQASLVTEQFPVSLDIGRVQAQLLPQDHAVAGDGLFLARTLKTSLAWSWTMLRWRSRPPPADRAPPPARRLLGACARRIVWRISGQRVVG